MCDVVVVEVEESQALDSFGDSDSALVCDVVEAEVKFFDCV